MARTEQPPHPTWVQPYETRATQPNTSPLAAYLFRLMAVKKTNLCLSADLQYTSQLLNLAEECGDSICILKTHCDIVVDFSERTIKGLMEIAQRKKFLLFEDRKFGDIGNTVQLQYASGTHRIASWASLTNAHIFPGPAIITSLKSAALSALAAYNSSISTEIIGGASAREKNRHGGKDEFTTDIQSTEIGRYVTGPRDRNSIARALSNGSEDSDGADTERGPGSRRGWSSSLEDDDDDYDDDLDIRPRSLDGRKGSVVSISTTFSTSTEVNSPLSGSTHNLCNSLHPDGSSVSAKTTYSSALETRPPLSRGLLLLAQMSSEGHLLDETYVQKCLNLAREQKDFVVGFIAQHSLNRLENDNFLTLTPGVGGLPPASEEERSRPVTSDSMSSGNSNSSRSPPSYRELQRRSGGPFFQISERLKEQVQPGGGGDGQGQQYNTPKQIVANQGSDVIIVGRAILNAEDRAFEAERYRKQGWAAYLERIGASG